LGRRDRSRAVILITHTYPHLPQMTARLRPLGRAVAEPAVIGTPPRRTGVGDSSFNDELLT
jgi:hypothetical protein